MLTPLNEGAMTLHMRTRLPDGSPWLDESAVLEKTVSWEGPKTAIIVCDIWDHHWCQGASDRVDELAPFVNGVLTSARKKGVLIVHAPSDTMNRYEGGPARDRAIQAPRVPLPAPKARPTEPPLPIDDSDEGCTSVESKPWIAWTAQHPAITIAPEDAISDDGAEIYSLFEQCGIQNVMMMGVHTNMCVLRRSFGLRRLVEMGKKAVLVRDLTDSMYNPARSPFVSHCRGTGLVVAHIETYICPSILSTDLTGAPPFRFREDTDSIA